MKKRLCFWAATAVSLFFSIATFASETKESLKDLREAFKRAAVVSYAPDGDVTDRYMEYSDYGRANDVLLLQLYMSVHLPEAELERLISLLDDNGCWTDIDYNDKTRGRWQPTLHLTRLYALTKLYADPSSSHYKDPELSKIIHRLMAGWLALRPECPNWWHNEIGVPKRFASVMLMIYDELTPEEMRGGLELLERSTVKMTGQNRAWLAGNLLMRGMLTDDAALVQKSRDVIAEGICVTTKEGIQPDWSYHQHGPQIQFGNYGLAYVESLSFWFRVLENSPYAYSQKQFDVIDNLIGQGIAWSVWKGLMDPNYCGRQNFINAGTGKAYSLAVAMQNLAATSYKGSEKYHKMALGNLLPEKYNDTLVGSRYFWRSDCGVYRTGNWYASIRMHSERTVGYEITNRENLLSNFSADGAMHFLEKGDEYLNIFAHLDWYRLPGVTAFENGKPMKCTDDVKLKRNNSKWCGGASTPNTLASSVEINRDGLTARKSNFFFKDFTVSLGCGINTDDPECASLFTGVNQTHLDGKVVVGKDDSVLHTIPENQEADMKFMPGEVSWVHHDNFGYVLLDNAELSLSTLNQTGKWDYMDPFYVDCVQEGRVFKTWINHDPSEKGNSYAYAVLPCHSVEKTRSFAVSPRVRILRNDSGCQAVANSNAVCAVFYEAGSVETPQGLLSVDAPAIVIVEDGIVSLSSPCPESETLNLSLTGGITELRHEYTIPVDPANCGKTLSVPMTFTDASELTMIGKALPTSNPYHRIDTTIYKGFTQKENQQVRCAAGLAIVFKTNSSRIDLKAGYAYASTSPGSTRISAEGFDLYIRRDGEWVYAASPGPVRDKAFTLISDMGYADKECLLYLPHYSELKSLEVGVEQGCYIESMENPFRHKVVIFGSSFTHGMSTARAGMSYPLQIERNTGIEFCNLGCSGNCRLQDYFAAYLADIKDADAFVFDGFSNGSADNTRRRLIPFIERIRESLPGVPLIFVETIDRESSNFNLKKRRIEEEKRVAADEMMGKAIKEFDNVYFIDSEGFTGYDHATSADATHPSDLGYWRWAQALQPKLMKILKKHGIK